MLSALLRAMVISFVTVNPILLIQMNYPWKLATFWLFGIVVWFKTHQLPRFLCINLSFSQFFHKILLHIFWFLQQMMHPFWGQSLNFNLWIRFWVRFAKSHFEVRAHVWQKIQVWGSHFALKPMIWCWWRQRKEAKQWFFSFLKWFLLDWLSL